MAISRADRRREREQRVVRLFGVAQAPCVLDLLELLELAWHDCYGEITPSDVVIEDVFAVSEGTLSGMVQACHLAVTDWRDLRMAADHVRGRR
ncbi:MAG: hypothetical protein ABMA25_01490 [Ilumatobacteraceae bacterium]